MTESEGEFGAVWGTALTRLFHELYREKRTGILVVERGEEVSQVFFREGRLAGAIVHGQVKPLGVSLLESGVIDIEALSASLTIKAKTVVPQGQVLLELGAITREQLHEALRNQLISRVAHLLLLPDGEWFIEAERDNFPPWTLDLSVRPGMAVLAALSQPSGAPHLHRILEELGSTRLALRVEAPEITEYFDLEPEEARVLAHLDGEREIEAVAEAAGLELPRVLALVGALSVFHLVGTAGGDRELRDLLPVPEAEQLSRLAPPPPLPRPEEEDPEEVLLPPPPAPAPAPAPVEALPPPEPEPEIAIELESNATPEPEPPPEPEPAAGPAQNGQSSNRFFSAGMVFFEHEDYESALPLLRDAVHEDPEQGLWTAYFAWALYMVGPTEKVAPQVRQLLQMAAETSDGEERARYFLDQIGDTGSDDSLDAWM